MRRALPLLLIPILVVWLALPRDFPATSEAFVPGAGTSGGGSSAASLVTGAPSVPEVLDSGDGQPGPAPSGAVSNTRSGPSGAPTPSQKLGDFSSYQKPQPRIVDGISGEATWWYSFGSGIYAALRPDLGSKGDLVIVCGGQPYHCRTAQVITTCACLGPNSERLVDLSRDLFAEFADPSLGVVRIVLQVVRD